MLILLLTTFYRLESNSKFIWTYKIYNYCTRWILNYIIIIIIIFIIHNNINNITNVNNYNNGIIINNKNIINININNNISNIYNNNININIIIYEFVFIRNILDKLEFFIMRK